MNLRFFWNGIKAADGKLQGCYYSADCQLINHPAGTITIYGKRYRDFSPEVGAAFKVENGTELQSDYFENDRIRVEPNHPLYAQVLGAVNAGKAHSAKLDSKRATVQS